MHGSQCLHFTNGRAEVVEQIAGLLEPMQHVLFLTGSSHGSRQQHANVVGVAAQQLCYRRNPAEEFSAKRRRAPGGAPEVVENGDNASGYHGTRCRL